MKAPPLVCPIDSSPTDFDLETLVTLLAELERDALPELDRAFDRGTLLADGRLDLCKQNLGVQGCAALVSALERNRQVHALLLGTNGIADAGAQTVARLIRAGHLTTIYLGCNLITQAGVEALCQAIEDTNTVQALWLKRNPIGPNGAQRIASMLRGNTSMKTLDLVNTGIGEAGFHAIIRSLIDQNRTLEYLYLSGNGLDEQEAPLLAELLRVNPTLKGLFLSVNRLADTGLNILLQGLEANSALEFLGLASNEIGDKTAPRLFAAVSAHPNLRALDLGYSPSTRVLQAVGNQVGDASLPAVLRLLEGSQLLDLDLSRNQFGQGAKAQILNSLEQNFRLQRLKMDSTDPNLERLLLRNRNIAPASFQVPYSQLIRSVYR